MHRLHSDQVSEDMDHPAVAPDTVQPRDCLGGQPSHGSIFTGPTCIALHSSLCNFCEYDERHGSPTTALKRRSGQRHRNVKDVRQRASEGCWLCQCVLNATRLWNDDFPGETEKLLQLYIRFDAERFTVRGPQNLPVIQIYSPFGKQQVPS